MKIPNEKKIEEVVESFKNYINGTGKTAYDLAEAYLSVKGWPCKKGRYYLPREERIDRCGEPHAGSSTCEGCNMTNKEIIDHNKSHTIFIETPEEKSSTKPSTSADWRI